jgi:CBS domain-containing protein
MLVREVMTAHPVTVRGETTAREALTLLDQHSVTSLPVVTEDSVVVGMLSEADLLVGRLLPDDRSSILPRSPDVTGPAVDRVDALMSRRPVTVTADTDLADAAKVMTTTGFKCLPVVDERSRILGVISRRDIVRTLARSDADVERDLATLFTIMDVDWTAEVVNGRVRISGPADDKSRSLAHAAASTVPGILNVRVS